MNRQEILHWLTEPDAGALGALWQRADRLRAERVGTDVHLRGLIELSNRCRRNCLYCGLRAGNDRLERFTMTAEEVLAAAGAAARELGYGTVVLQAGEAGGLDAHAITELISRLRERLNLAITLSLGEWSEDVLAAWRQAGADRYLLRIEASNPRLHRRLHPPLAGEPTNGPLKRIEQLKTLRRLGYEIGSGVMVGLPGQTYADLADDILTFAELDLDMIGLGPYLPHPATPLAAEPLAAEPAVGARPGPDDAVPNSETMAYKAVALARLACPDANIPATTAVNVVNRACGYEQGLQRGANVIMPNLTPARYRKLYEIYPGKTSGEFEDPRSFRDGLTARIEAIGRRVGAGRGDSPRYLSRLSPAAR